MIYVAFGARPAGAAKARGRTLAPGQRRREAPP